MKKIATWIFCVVMILALALPVCAASQLQFALNPSATAAQPGETVTITVEVKGDAYTSIGYIPVFDAAVWEIVDAKCLFEDMLLGEFSLTEGGVMAFPEGKVRDGAAFQFTLKVKEGAAAGETAITGMVAANNDSEAVNAVLTDAKITIGKEAAKPVETTPATTQPEQSVDAPDATVATMESQAATEATGQMEFATDATAPEGTEALNKEEVKDLEGGDACLGAEDVLTVGPLEPAEPVAKENPLPWVIAGAVVVVVAVAAWFFLRKKGDKTEE